MRKTLLIAAAALASSVISSQAGVYSQNIVGYANTVIPSGYSIACNPFDDGAGDLITNVAPSLPIGASVLFWNGVGYNTAVYVPGGGSPGNTAFYDGNTGNDIATPTVPPGTAFFIQNPASALTNTWVGTVVTNNVTLASGYSLVASAVPYAGDVTNSAINLNLLIGASLLFWNGNGFDTAVYVPGGGSPGNTAFYDGNTGNDIADPNLKVGAGFFYQNPATAVTWTQAYP
jgi:hypothetical protein